MTSRTTNAELNALLAQLNDATGLHFDWHQHNGKGYGILHLQKPGTHTITNQIAGNMWEGVNKREACCIIRAIFNLLDMGADLSAVAGKVN